MALCVVGFGWALFTSIATAAPREQPGTAIRFSAAAGFASAPFELNLAVGSPALRIYFTTNGELPTPAVGQLWEKPQRIEHTTTIRAAGFADGRLVTPVATRTFLFTGDVLRQSGAGAPATWGTNNGQLVAADYEMDREIVEHPAYRDVLPSALLSLPSVSIVMAPEDVWDPARGIYSNPKETGDDWERMASVEWLPADGSAAFEVSCGIRIQGGWNRRPEESPKHAFRLAFRKKYGLAKLKQRLFAEAGTDEFEGLILRAGCNNSWLHWSGEERRRGDYIRDQWMRDTYAVMGQPSARGRFVHLYLNGLYWGLYNLAERPDEHFAARHFGAKAKDIDARNADKILSGDDAAWTKMFRLANAGVRDDAAYRALGELLDLDAFIDFMALNLYGANGDWDRASNWYAARRRSPPGPFVFFVWDGERTLEDVAGNVLAFDDDLSPPRLFHKLRENEQFRARFAERTQRHLATNGVLGSIAAAKRFRELADQIDGPIVAESARWGDYRRDAHRYKTGPYELYARDTHWRPEVRRLMEEYFPKRTEVFTRQLEEAGLCRAQTPR